jgi:hypothetical protein
MCKLMHQSKSAGRNGIIVVDDDESSYIIGERETSEYILTDICIPAEIMGRQRRPVTAPEHLPATTPRASTQPKTPPESLA